MINHGGFICPAQDLLGYIVGAESISYDLVGLGDRRQWGVRVVYESADTRGDLPQDRHRLIVHGVSYHLPLLSEGQHHLGLVRAVSLVAAEGTVADVVLPRGGDTPDGVYIREDVSDPLRGRTAATWCAWRSALGGDVVRAADYGWRAGKGACAAVPPTCRS